MYYRDSRQIIKGLSILVADRAKDKEMGDRLVCREMRKHRLVRTSTARTLRLTFDTDASGTNERN